MAKNFMAMPIFLKLLTAAALGMILVIVVTVIPGGSIRVFGRNVADSEWWRIGAGPFMAIVTLLMIASAVMMLKRTRHSRLAYVIAWIALSISIPFVAGVAGVGVAVSKPALFSNLLLTLAISLYLYLSKGARAYFRSPPK